MALRRFPTPKWLPRAVKPVPLLLCLGIGTAAGADGVNTGYFGNVAIKGYDPVAYFTEGRPTKGLPEFSYDWLGATWQFSNAGNRDAFASEPIRYAPQYGGFCALGTANRGSLRQHRSGRLADRRRKTLPVRRTGRPGGGLRCSRRRCDREGRRQVAGDPAEGIPGPAGDRQLSVGLQPLTWGRGPSWRRHWAIEKYRTVVESG